jgi:hypothetical protein
MDKKKGFTLNEIISESLNEFESDSEKISYLFRSGLQDFITLLSALYLAGVSNGKKVPPGFTGKFVKAFSSPTLGGILDGFLLWIVGQEEHPSMSKLSVYLMDVEKRGKGWLVPMVQWRNKFEHPQDYSQKEVLENSIPLLSAIPDFSSFGQIILQNEGQIVWESEGLFLNLEPFICLHEQRIKSFTEYKERGKLIFRPEQPECQAAFEKLWSELRILDTQLEKPSLEDIKEKLYRVESPVASFQNPWWVNDILNNPAFCRFIEPGSINNHLIISEKKETNILFLKCQVKESQPPMEMICYTLGLAPLKNIQELTAILQENILILNIDTTGIGFKTILSLLLWIADMHDGGASKQIRILIKRKADELENDQQKLWERLPDNLDSIFCKAPGLKGSELKNYYWSTETKKKLFGIF